MGHATFHIDADDLVHLLDKFSEKIRKHPTMMIENATLVYKDEEGKYRAIGSCSADMVIDQLFSEKPKTNLRLILRVIP